MDTFTFVFFLLKDEHVVVEELLKFFVGEVNTKLLESVELENLETSDVKYTDEVVSRQVGFQSDVQAHDDPVEQVLVRCFCKSTG